MSSLYAQAPAVVGPEHELPSWSVMYKSELRLCAWLRQRGSTGPVAVTLDLVDLTAVVRPHAPMQSLIALAELGLIDELEMTGERVHIVYDSTALAGLVDELPQHVTHHLEAP